MFLDHTNLSQLDVIHKLYHLRITVWILSISLHFKQQEILPILIQQEEAGQQVNLL